MATTADRNRTLRYRSETVPAELTAIGGWVATGADKIPHHPGTCLLYTSPSPRDS